jgi:endonuclease-8
VLPGSQLTLGRGQVGSSRSGDIAGAHRSTDADPGRAAADDPGQTAACRPALIAARFGGLRSRHRPAGTRRPVGAFGRGTPSTARPLSRSSRLRHRTSRYCKAETVHLRGGSIVPEGHTIARVAREHTAMLVGRPLRLTSPQGRFAEGAALLDGAVLERISPYGKHLFYGFAGSRWLHVHLGLYGTLRSGPLPAPAVRGALRLRMTGETGYVDLRGPTACELLTPAEKRAIEARLGPDPLHRGADPAPAWRRIVASPTAIGALLMDQSVIAGIGNVYRAEVLFQHRMDPHRPGRSLTEAQWHAIWTDLRTLLRAGVRAGRIVTTLPRHRDRRSGPASRADCYYVYRRTGLPCRICGTPVATEVMVGRNLYWCPGCQPA